MRCHAYGAIELGGSGLKALHAVQILGGKCSEDSCSVPDPESTGFGKQWLRQCREQSDYMPRY